MASLPLKVAVIGAGNMGGHHVRNYSVLPEAELAALADVNKESKKLADEHDAKFYTDYKKMIDEEQLDAVSIVVPTPLHYEVASYAMERRVHCLVEKPIAHSLDEADKLIKLAKINNLVFTVGHIERYNPIIRAIKSIVDEGKLGDITSIVCQRVGGFPKIEPKTDVIIDLAVHDVDILNYLIGKYPDRIHSHASRTHHSQKVDSTEILMDYGQTSGFVRANWLTPVKIRTISITGSKGYLEGNYITQELMYYEHNMQKVKDTRFSTFVLTVGEPKKHIIPVDFEEPLAVELKAFLHHVAGNKKVQLVDPKDAKEALRLSLIAVKDYEGEKN